MRTALIVVVVTAVLAGLAMLVSSDGQLSVRVFAFPLLLLIVLGLIALKNRLRPRGETNLLDRTDVGP